MRLLALLLFFPLTGCVAAGAATIVDAQKLHDALVTFVEERHQSRRDIRKDCEELLDFCVQEFRDSGDLGGAAKVLNAAYAPPLTLEIINNVIDKSEGEEINAFADAHVCQAVSENCGDQAP
jgi:hypothetical protein